MVGKDYTNSFILDALNIPVINDLESLSRTLALSRKLVYVLSKETHKFYKEFEIKKRDGTLRKIHSPSYSLKLVQRWILKEILEKIGTSNQTMAFKRGNDCGIKKNASYHCYSLYILEMDIKDFFTSIKREKVFYLFKKVGYNNLISYILANLCTFDGYLPQGGVCSPYISNLICYKLDKRLTGLCGKLGIIYTRYADDLTFSCDNKQTLNKIKNIVSDILVSEGFELNKKKTRLLSPISHKIVTGLTVNDGHVKASKELKRKVRAMIHNAIVSGDYKDIDKIRGIISFINSIEDCYKDKIIKYIDKFKSKDYVYYKEVVEEFNNHKIFSAIDDMSYKNTDDLIPKYPNMYDEDDYYIYGEFTSERKEFIKRKDITDFVDYSKWTDLYTDVEDDDELPF